MLKTSFKVKPALIFLTSKCSWTLIYLASLYQVAWLRWAKRPGHLTAVLCFSFPFEVSWWLPNIINVFDYNMIILITQFTLFVYLYCFRLSCVYWYWSNWKLICSLEQLFINSKLIQTIIWWYLKHLCSWI